LGFGIGVARKSSAFACINIYCHSFGGLKPPALAGSFSISS
jgi:predicted CxxxxCH...CXXCH cytochrome family protein